MLIERRLSALMIIVLLAPYEALAQKVETDSRDDELKGQVQMVIGEKASLTKSEGMWIEGRRELAYVISYDNVGNRVRYESYYQGELARASESVSFGGDRGVKNNPVMARDPFKVKYKYDARGNRTEVTWVDKDGVLWSRDVRTYDAKGNKISETQYKPDGTRADIANVKYDRRGNITNRWSHSDVMGYDSTSSYTYEFDPEGNWIRSVESVRTTKEGKPFYELNTVTFRIIFYYQ